MTVKVSDLDFRSSFTLTIKQNDTWYVSLSMYYMYMCVCIKYM